LILLKVVASGIGQDDYALFLQPLAEMMPVLTMTGWFGRGMRRRR
jgi:hypothetical protein